jgi:hypothetical protein
MIEINIENLQQMLTVDLGSQEHSIVINHLREVQVQFNSLKEVDVITANTEAIQCFMNTINLEVFFGNLPRGTNNTQKRAFEGIKKEIEVVAGLINQTLQSLNSEIQSPANKEGSIIDASNLKINNKVAAPMSNPNSTQIIQILTESLITLKELNNTEIDDTKITSFETKLEDLNKNLEKVTLKNVAEAILIQELLTEFYDNLSNLIRKDNLLDPTIL